MHPCYNPQKLSILLLSLSLAAMLVFGLALPYGSFLAYAAYIRATPAV
jgi:hypothetical protein